MSNFDPAREELEHVAGDDPDRSSGMGSFDLTQGKLGSVRVRYGDQMVFCEVYQHPGEPMQSLPLKLPAFAVAQLQAQSDRLHCNRGALARTLILRGLEQLQQAAAAEVA